MKTKVFDPDWSVARPLATLGRTFAVLALIFCVATPFANDLPSRWTFLFAGFGYSAFLSVFVIGLALLPWRARRRAFAALFIGFAFSFLVPILIFGIFYFRLPLAIFHLILPPLLWVYGAFLALLFASACYGWYHRLVHNPNAHEYVA